MAFLIYRLREQNLKVKPFSLENWFAKYELQCRINISESGILPIDFSWLNADLSDLKLYYSNMLRDMELRELIAGCARAL